jgi:hypothetical protein
MATVPPAPCVSVGDFVAVENSLCYVDKIENNLGFNTYIVVNIDKQESMRKSRHEIQPLDYLLQEFCVESIPEEMKTEKGQETELNPKKRFAEVTTDDLDTLAVNRTSKRTRTQTSWAVSVFKGKGRWYKHHKQSCRHV